MKKTTLTFVLTFTASAVFAQNASQVQKLFEAGEYQRVVDAAQPDAEADRVLDSVAHTSPAELMEARLRIEPALAELIVTNATPADFERMETCLDKAERGATLDEFELWDAALHQAIATATHNRFVIRVLDMVTAVRQQAEWGKLKDRIVTPERRIKYQEEHRNIVRALKERDAERARAFIIDHLQHARRNLFGF